MGKYKVCLVGSGNWGSAISKNLGHCVKRYHEEFEEIVKMWVFEEVINGRKLTEIINTEHENIKYLPGYKLPENIVAEPDLVTAATDADVLVFVVPHQFVPRILKTLQGKIKPTAIGISLIKGVGDPAEDGSMKLISDEITAALNIDVAVLMGANLANEVAAGNFCEGTIGCKNPEQAARLKRLFQTDNYRVHTVPDYHTVELCGALKNVVACAAGFVDAMELGDNTKAAVIRLGFVEMQRFIEHFYPGSNIGTFFESCGMGDLITTCYGGRNRRVSEAFIRTGKSIDVLEKEMLGGQHLQGPPTAAQVNKMLKSKNLEKKFPLFTSVHNIITRVWEAPRLINELRDAHI